MSHAFLILCHRPPRYWLRLAQSAPESRFYLHYDAKADWTEARELAADCSNVRLPTGESTCAGRVSAWWRQRWSCCAAR